MASNANNFLAYLKRTKKTSTRILESVYMCIRASGTQFNQSVLNLHRNDQ